MTSNCRSSLAENHVSSASRNATYFPVLSAIPRFRATEYSTVWLVMITNGRLVVRQYCAGVVRRTVIDHQNFNVGEGLLEDAVHGGRDILRRVVGGNDDRNERHLST